MLICSLITEFVPEELYDDFHNEIEKKFPINFLNTNIWSNQKEITEKIIEEISYLINNEK